MWSASAVVVAVMVDEAGPLIESQSGSILDGDLEIARVRPERACPLREGSERQPCQALPSRGWRDLDGGDTKPAPAHRPASDRQDIVAVPDGAHRGEPEMVAVLDDGARVARQAATSVVVGGDPGVIWPGFDLDAPPVLVDRPLKAEQVIEVGDQDAYLVEGAPALIGKPSVRDRRVGERHLELRRQSAGVVPRLDQRDRLWQTQPRLAHQKHRVRPAGEAVPGAQQPVSEPFGLKPAPTFGGDLLELTAGQPQAARRDD